MLCDLEAANQSKDRVAEDEDEAVAEDEAANQSRTKLICCVTILCISQLSHQCKFYHLQYIQHCRHKHKIREYSDR